MNTQNETPSEEQIRASRLKLILVLGCFLGPLAVAFIWYYGFGAQMLSSSTVNHAKLLSPVVALEKFSDPDHAGQQYSEASLKRKWTVFHIVSGDCSEQCQQALYNTRQTRLALGKDAHRFFRVILVSENDLKDGLIADHPDARFVLADDSNLAIQLEKIRSANELGQHDAILVDPLANAMMVIDLELNPSLLLKDLKKLLKLSKIG